MILNEKLVIINIGASIFLEELADQGVESLQLEWTPPANEKEEHVLALIETIQDF